jgi:glyoxylase-like metal-dependent hydrolase (beta-lactamase superfamily II)
VLSCILLAAAVSACSQKPEPTPLENAAASMGVADVTALEFSGTGRWFQFGQSAAPGLPWPQFDVSSYTATIDYVKPAARVQITRKQTVEEGRVRPTPVEQKVDQYVDGTLAWNVPTAPAAGGNVPPPQAQPAAVAERQAEIWTSPHGFIKAAVFNKATTTAADGGTQVEFVADGRRYEGFLDASNQVTRVRTWIDNTVFGDTPLEVTYADYRKFGDLSFPGKISRSMGGHPVLDLTVTSVAKASPQIAAPPEASTVAPVEVTVETIAKGVHYLRGGSHHSIAVDQADGIVVIEAPLHEERSNAVIAKVKELIPNKPIRFIVNSHHHFDHSGGLRTYVDEGATVVTHASNQPFYEQAWAAPRTLNADRLATSGKTAQFQTFTDKLVLKDKDHPVEVHHIAGNGHNDAFAMVYLPKERVLIEGDAWTPAAAGAPAPTTANPYTVNLLENVEKLKLNVRTIAALHGPGVATLAQLRAAANAGK